MYSSSGTMRKCIKTDFKAMALKEREESPLDIVMANAVVDSMDNWIVVTRQSHPSL